MASLIIPISGARHAEKLSPNPRLPRESRPEGRWAGRPPSPGGQPPRGPELSDLGRAHCVSTSAKLGVTASSSGLRSGGPLAPASPVLRQPLHSCLHRFLEQNEHTTFEGFPPPPLSEQRPRRSGSQTRPREAWPWPRLPLSPCPRALLGPALKERLPQLPPGEGADRPLCLSLCQSVPLCPSVSWANPASCEAGLPASAGLAFHI